MAIDVKTGRAIDLWLLDLALTAVSFLLAYQVRFLFDLQGHTVMPMDVYLPLLAIILPVWAIVLPISRVYSDTETVPLWQVWRVIKAICASWLIMLTMQFILSRSTLLANRGGSGRLLLLFTLAINVVLLASYRVLLFRKQRYESVPRSTERTETR